MSAPKSTNEIHIAFVENGVTAILCYLPRSARQRWITKLHAAGARILDVSSDLAKAKAATWEYDQMVKRHGDTLEHDLLRSVLANEARLALAKTEPAPAPLTLVRSLRS